MRRFTLRCSGQHYLERKEIEHDFKATEGDDVAESEVVEAEVIASEIVDEQPKREQPAERAEQPEDDGQPEEDSQTEDEQTEDDARSDDRQKDRVCQRTHRSAFEVFLLFGEHCHAFKCVL